MDGVDLVRQYYRLIDGGEYGSLADVLTEGIVHYRPDMTIEGREAFVEFMARDRPERETEHAVESIYEEQNGTKVAAEGRLCSADGRVWFRFVDTFEIGDGGIETIRTHTDLDPE